MSFPPPHFLEKCTNEESRHNDDRVNTPSRSRSPAKIRCRRWKGKKTKKNRTAAELFERNCCCSPFFEKCVQDNSKIFRMPMYAYIDSYFSYTAIDDLFYTGIFIKKQNKKQIWCVCVGFL